MVVMICLLEQNRKEYQRKCTAEEDISTAIAGVGARKDVIHLSATETENLRQAIRRGQVDKGSNDFQKIASYHGSPAQCQHNNHSFVWDV